MVGACLCNGVKWVGESGPILYPKWGFHPCSGGPEHCAFKLLNRSGLQGSNSAEIAGRAAPSNYRLFVFQFCSLAISIRGYCREEIRGVDRQSEDVWSGAGVQWCRSHMIMNTLPTTWSRGIWVGRRLVARSCWAHWHSSPDARPLAARINCPESSGPIRPQRREVMSRLHGPAWPLAAT